MSKIGDVLQVAKELNEDHLTKVAQVAPVRKDAKLLGSKRAPKNHTWYQMNMTTMEITAAELKSRMVYRAGKHVEVRSTVLHPGCIVEHALNMRNAKKRFFNLIQKTSLR